MKKMLMTATVPSMIGQFNMSNIEILQEFGYEVHVGCNFKNYSYWDKQKIGEFVNELKEKDVVCHQIDFGRSPFSKNSYIAYKQIKALLKNNSFSLLHCHTPVASAISRIAAAKLSLKSKIKVIYTCHGFHFHKKSGIKSWLLYYPVEFITSIFTDMIIAINHEDYNVIRKFPVKFKKYIPGVGVDTYTISNRKPNISMLRKEYHIPENAFLILSIGELSDRKNQGVIINVIGNLHRQDIYYLICGTGENEKKYKQLCMDVGVQNNVIFAGHVDHDKVIDLCHACDIGALPSTIEGLGLAGIETMSAGKPMIGSNVHGIKDYIINGNTGFTLDPEDSKGFAEAIETLADNKNLYNKMAKNAAIKASEFDITKSRKLMKDNYLIFN